MTITHPKRNRPPVGWLLKILCALLFVRASDLSDKERDIYEPMAMMLIPLGLIAGVICLVALVS